ncbi:BON domain-containing protein [Alcaligenaceae bacterium SJ-26]|nr:BON domain-containing protein [Alcaligenaceae bacterium SJ-26]
MIQSQSARRLPGTLALCGVLAATTLSACAPLIVGGAAATTAVVVTDRRTAGTQLEDQSIAIKVDSAEAQHFGDRARINASAYQHRVLLTGDVPNQTDKDEATRVAQGVENVKEVINQLNIGPPASFSERSGNSWLASKVRTTLINTRDVPSRTITVTAERGVVYLMGRVTQHEGNLAAAAAASVSGVREVVKLFEILTPEEAARLAEEQRKAETKRQQESQAETITP